jgi:prepilin-type N-terminal cleavage/methylation domain-containing protein
MRWLRHIFNSERTHANAGFSMVEMIVSLGLIAVAAVGIQQGLETSRMAHSMATASVSASHYMSTVESIIAGRTRLFVADSCSGTRFGFTGTASSPGNLPVGRAFSTLSLTGSPTTGLGDLSFTTSPTTFASAFSTAAARCANVYPGTAGMGAIGATTGQYIHFCMNFNVDPTSQTVERDSLTTSDGAFIELTMLPLDLLTNTAVQCTDVINEQQGIKVVYTVYVSKKTKGTNTLVGTTMNGVFNVAPQATKGACQPIPGTLLASQTALHAYAATGDLTSQAITGYNGTKDGGIQMFSSQTLTGGQKIFLTATPSGKSIYRTYVGISSFVNCSGYGGMSYPTSYSVYDPNHAWYLQFKNSSGGIITDSSQTFALVNYATGVVVPSGAVSAWLGFRDGTDGSSYDDNEPIRPAQAGVSTDGCTFKFQLHSAGAACSSGP